MDTITEEDHTGFIANMFIVENTMLIYDRIFYTKTYTYVTYWNNILSNNFKVGYKYLSEIII